MNTPSAISSVFHEKPRQFKQEGTEKMEGGNEKTEIASRAAGSLGDFRYGLTYEKTEIATRASLNRFGLTAPPSRCQDLRSFRSASCRSALELGRSGSPG
jgi:hypothetical protein